MASTTEHDGAEIRAIATAPNWIFVALYWPPFAAAIGLLLLSLTRRKSWFPSPSFAVPGLFAVVVAWFAGNWILWNNWQVVADGVGPDANRYAVLARAMLGDYDEALCRPSERSGVLRTRYEVLLSVSNGRGQLRSVSMIRPASTEDARLVFGADGWVAAITDGHCRWIYDTRDGHGVVGDELPRRSPFLFLDDVTPGREDDLAAITKRVVSPYLLDDSPQTRFLLAHPDDPASKDLYRDEDLFVEIPTESSLLDALDSKNPWIRSATRRIIAAGGADMYPDATRRLASAPK